MFVVLFYVYEIIGLFFVPSFVASLSVLSMVSHLCCFCVLEFGGVRSNCLMGVGRFCVFLFPLGIL